MAVAAKDAGYGNIGLSVLIGLPGGFCNLFQACEAGSLNPVAVCREHRILVPQLGLDNPKTVSGALSAKKKLTTDLHGSTQIRKRPRFQPSQTKSDPC